MLESPKPTSVKEAQPATPELSEEEQQSRTPEIPAEAQSPPPQTSGEQAESVTPPEASAEEAQSGAPETSGETQQIIFTVRAGTGEVLSAEIVDNNGVRGNLSKEQALRMIASDAASDFESAVFDVLQDDDFLEGLALLRLVAR